LRFGYGADADQAEQTWCEHAICREEQARDLAYLGAALNRNDLRVLAAQAHVSTVRCRLQPRKGPVWAPLPKSTSRERVFRTEDVQLCDIPPPPRRA